MSRFVNLFSAAYAALLLASSPVVALAGGESVDQRLQALEQQENPALLAPAVVTTRSGEGIRFSASRHRQFALAGIAGTEPCEVTLSVGDGSLTVTTATGVSFELGDGRSDATMRFRGTVRDANRALSGLSYEPAPGFAGRTRSSVRVPVHWSGKRAPWWPSMLPLTSRQRATRFSQG